jgi:PhnB protein
MADWFLDLKEVGMAKAKKAVPEGYHTVTPSLTLDNAAQAIDWYKKALGAQELSRAAGPDGKIMHAEILIGDSRIMVNDPMMGTKGPKALGGSPASLWIYVEDCDALFNRAISAGGQVHGAMGKMQDQFWGDRSGSFQDPHGYIWTIATHKEDLSPEEMKQRQAEWMKNFAPQATHG